MSLLSPAELDDLKARNPVADVAAKYTTLRKIGKLMAGPCPMCGGKKRNGRFRVLKDGVSWHCAVCSETGDVIALVQRVEGLDFKAAVEQLGGTRPIDPDLAARLARERDAKQKQREEEESRYREAERKRLYEWWNAAQDLPGSIAARYLEGRGLIVPALCPGLRFAPSMPYFHGDEVDDFGRKSPRVVHRGPAMLGAFIRPDGHFGGLHITWLDDGDPPRKIKLIDPDVMGPYRPGDEPWLPAKKMRGSKTGAFILAAKGRGVARRIFIAEGIETILSAYTAFVATERDVHDGQFDQTQWWAAGDLGNLGGPHADNVVHPTLKTDKGRPRNIPGPVPDLTKPSIAIPDEVTELILLGDGDSEPVLTRHAVTRAARRYAREGRTIRIAFAPAGLDFNDVLQGDEG